MSKNAELVRIFLSIGDLLDLIGEERFKPEAYRRAARSLESLGEDIQKVSDRGGLDDIPGVGAAIAEKIREYLRTGKIAYYDRLCAQVPPGLLTLMQIPGVGPKTTRRFWVELQVEDPRGLSQAIAEGRLTGMSGFGPRKIESLTEGLKGLGAAPGGAGERHPVVVAWELAERVASDLRRAAPVKELVIAGSLRRARETIGDIDLLATSSEPEKVFDAFSHLDGIREVRLRGETKETVLFDPGIQIDLRVVAPESYGAALQYFTGSKDHNIRLRTLARDRGLKINEYGVMRGDTRIAGLTEEEVYAALDLPFIPAEIRENRGEIEAALERRVPRLVELSQVACDLHLHWDDPTTEMPGPWIDAARALGLHHLGVVLPESDGAREMARGLRTRWREADPPSTVGLLVGLERPARTGPVLPEGFDYLALAAGPGDPPPIEPPGPVPLFVGHLPPPGQEPRHRWIAWAQREKVGLELTPDPTAEGLDSGDAQRVVAGEGRLFVTSAARRPAELHRIELAVRLARRGWVPPGSVGNTRDPGTPSASPEARRRPRARRGGVPGARRS